MPPSTSAPSNVATIGRTRCSLRARCGDVRRQPSRVGQTPTSTRHVSPPSATTLVCTISSSGAASAWWMAKSAWPCTSAGQLTERRVGPCAHVVPAAQLDRPELRMVERIPGDAHLRMVLVGPLSTASSSSSVGPGVPEVRRLLGARGGLDDVPELGGPREHAEVVVRPVVGGAAHRVALVEREVLVDRVDGVAGERRAALAELLVRPHVHRRQRTVALRDWTDAGSRRRRCGTRCSRRCSGRAITARTSASISGSLSGWSPLPVTPVPQPDGKLRFMSRPSGGFGRGDGEAVVVDHLALVHAPGIAAPCRRCPRSAPGRMTRGSVSDSIHAPFGSAMRIDSMRPSPSMSRSCRPGRVARVAPRPRAHAAAPVAVANRRAPTRHRRG